jgi:ElaB/YqjD/DUF883 family membrane-anchored ribosome-binding protein
MAGKKHRKAQKAAAEAAEAAIGAARAAEDGFDAAHRFVKRQLKEHPAVVLSAAAAIGLLIGLLVSGRRR